MSVEFDVVATSRVRDRIVRDMFKVIVRVREELHTMDARAIAYDEVVRANNDCEVRSGQKFWITFWVYMGSVRGCRAKALNRN